MMDKFYSEPRQSSLNIIREGILRMVWEMFYVCEHTYNIDILSTREVAKLLSILILILLAELFATYPAKSASYVQLFAACELFSTK